ncbi:hypothetical protein L218DRAFT_951032 [Marasmius fiardii PR-910]|nr:hypothetical protein L218DRAFT_951032 [Marasmius fiardii PR-910]
MGVTTALMDSLYPWALQYCIDACSCPNLIKAPICHYYAEVFINAQHRLMFYLLPIPSDATYVAPAHWKPDHITEYRRRRAVVRHWKGPHNPKYSKDKEISANCHNPFPEDDTTTNGVASMVLDGALTQPSDGDQPIPGPSEIVKYKLLIPTYHFMMLAAPVSTHGITAAKTHKPVYIFVILSEAAAAIV